MSAFTYLIRGRRMNASPEEMQLTTMKWRKWLDELNAKGMIKDPGHPLDFKGKLISGKHRVVTDGPFTEAKDLIGGYLLIEAQDLHEAVEIAKGCPIFEEGGALEVRPIQVMAP
jgi:hypothetical protein